MSERERDVAFAALGETLRTEVTLDSLALLAGVLAFARHNRLTVADLWDCLIEVDPRLEEVAQTINAREAGRRRPQLAGMKGGRA